MKLGMGLNVNYITKGVGITSKTKIVTYKNISFEIHFIYNILQCVDMHCSKVSVDTLEIYAETLIKVKVTKK